MYQSITILFLQCDQDKISVLEEERLLKEIDQNNKRGIHEYHAHRR